MNYYCYEILGEYRCIEIPEVVIPPDPPAPGEEDPDGEITLPGGGTAPAIATVPPIVGLKQIAWHSEPWKTLWGVRTDGLLVGCTYDKDEDVWGWHRHPMANGAVTSICVIPSGKDEQNELWAVVRRVINEQTLHYIERMTPRYQPIDENDKTPYTFPDSALRYSGAPATSFTNANHLAGQTCRVWADGIDVGDVEVSLAGTFSLEDAAEDVVVGIHTDASFISLPTARLATERQIIAEVGIKFFETSGGKVGQLHGDMEDLQFRAPDTPMDESPPLYDGDKTITIGSRHDDTGVYTIIQNTAGPMTILAAFPKFKAA